MVSQLSLVASQLSLVALCIAAFSCGIAAFSCGLFGLADVAAFSCGTLLCYKKSLKDQVQAPVREEVVVEVQSRMPRLLCLFFLSMLIGLSLVIQKILLSSLCFVGSVIFL